MHFRAQPRNAAVLAATIGMHMVHAQTCSPSMFWVNFMNTPDQAHIGWTTPCNANAVVVYGFAANALNLTATGNTSTYTFASIYTSPYIHHTVLSGLPTSTQVFYRVGGTQSGFSGVMNFTTHPGVGPTIPLRFALIGDLGQTNNSADTIAHVASSPNAFNAILHAGDLSYADSDEPRWDSWQTLVAPLSQHFPWMTVVGNHEIEVDINLQTFEAYNARFLMPYVNYSTPQQSRQLWYSYEIGPIHFLMLSSYSAYDSTSPQYAWLQADLQAIDRTKTPWIICILHAPWYNTNTAHQGEGEAMRQSMEASLYNAGVDVVFAGHVHAYERSYRVYNNQVDPKGPYYITIGDGGNREGLAANWISPQAPYSAFRQASYGHGELEVINATTMLWTWHQNPDLEPTIADEFYIQKQSAQTERVLRGGGGTTAQPKFRVK